MSDWDVPVGNEALVYIMQNKLSLDYEKLSRGYESIKSICLTTDSTVR